MALLEYLHPERVMPLQSGLSTWGNGVLPRRSQRLLADGLLSWLVVGYLLPHTRAGRHAIAVGGNPQAAKMRGISLRKTRFGIFMTSGVLDRVAAVLFTASTVELRLLPTAPRLPLLDHRRHPDRGHQPQRRLWQPLGDLSQCRAALQRSRRRWRSLASPTLWRLPAIRRDPHNRCGYRWVPAHEGGAMRATLPVTGGPPRRRCTRPG